MVIFGMSGPLSAPIITGIYRDNYRDAIRGQAFGITLMLTAAVGLVVQFVGGGTLEQEVGYYRLFFAALAAATLIKAWAFLGMPAGAAEDEPARNPLGNFSAVWENSLFGYVLAAWFLFGFANLALMPQRIEYLSNPRYGLDLSPLQVTLIVGVTMEAARILVIQVWAQLFDRFNFIKLRIALSSLLLGHILLYYNTASLPLLFAGSALLGATLGGGGIAWMLWVTKFAPPEKTAQYMSIHTFLTGVRGTIAPLVGYLVMEYMKIQTASWLAGGLVMISILMLWRIRNEHPPAVKAT